MSAVEKAVNMMSLGALDVAIDGKGRKRKMRGRGFFSDLLAQVSTTASKASKSSRRAPAPAATSADETYFEFKPVPECSQVESALNTVIRLNETYQLTARMYNATIVLARAVEPHVETIHASKLLVSIECTALLCIQTQVRCHRCLK
jgi:hypothetical protein